MYSNWFVIPNPKSDAKARLFCIPFAGGSASSFTHWQKLIMPDAELVLVQLPGRGSRLFEKPITNMEDITVELGRAMQPLLDKPYVLFGHSLGGRIAYALTSSFSGKCKLPETLIVSASRPPHAPPKKEILHKLSDAELILKLRQLAGTPEVILESEEMIELYLPMIRADFRVAETFFMPPQITVDCNALVYGGLEDSAVSQEELEMWRECFSRPIKMEIFPGGHFFIETQRSAVVANINKTLLSACNSMQQTSLA